MNTRRLTFAALALPFCLGVARAQVPPALPVLDDKPSPHVDAGGPSAAVKSLAFSADGRLLYAAGLDKVVRVWKLRPDGRFQLQTTFRVPMGPDNAGAVNAVALSPDGAWVAMAGRAPMRGESGFREEGVILPSFALSPEQFRDAGVIYVASTKNPAAGKVLRGHRGGVRNLAFVPGTKDQPLLVSVATEQEGNRKFGGLRLWNAATGKALAEADIEQAKTDAHPGLAVWRTGPGDTQVRVAVAWRQENSKEKSLKSKLHLWDPGRNADSSLKHLDADLLTEPAALLGSIDQPQVLTGGLGGVGRLVTWDFSADPDPRQPFRPSVSFPEDNGIFFLPKGLAVIPGRGDRSPSHVAVVLRPDTNHPKEDYRLALADLDGGRAVAKVPLTGSDKDQSPVVAASRAHVAVAATRDHAVRIYLVGDLLQGRTKRVDLLAGKGLTPRQVAFVNEGKGLWLSEDDQDQDRAGGWLLDLDKRQIRARDGLDLAPDAPELGPWSVHYKSEEGKYKGVWVRNGEQDFPLVRPPEASSIVTRAALRPPLRGKPGVLAVAYTDHDANSTRILLCDPKEGKPYRLLFGHLQSVRGLAFSASRPLLASVADDETVCVWSLTDLNRQVGQVRGLGVTETEDKKVKVLQVEPGSPAAEAGLATNDVLEAIDGPGGVARPIKDAVSFLVEISARRPGEQVNVTVAGKGAVRLPVERGVAQRLPLFSVFLLRTDGVPDWVGWSPAGPYDFSSPAAEAHLGWHTNTGDEAAPVSFAPAGQYHKKYYRADILRYLAAAADPGRALRKWDEEHPPPQPTLRPLRPEGAIPTEQLNAYLVRQPVKVLRVAINEDYPLDDKQVLRWRLTRADKGKVKGDAPEHSGEARYDGSEWQVELEDVEWRRGQYQLHVGLHPRRDARELAGQTVTLRFQPPPPPPPKLTLRLEGTQLTTTEETPLKVEKKELNLDIDLEARANQKVEVRYSLFLYGKRLPGAPEPKTVIGPNRFKFKEKFTLGKGLNHLVARAVNQGVPAEDEDLEAATAEIWILYQPPNESPPSFIKLRLEPSPEVKPLELAQGGKKEGKKEELWVVSQPDVRLLGTVKADGVLVQDDCDWTLGDATKPLFEKPPGKVASIDVRLTLIAGAKPSRLVLRARSQNSDSRTEEHWVVYRPPLPDIDVDPLPLGIADVQTDQVTLKGTFQPASLAGATLSWRVVSEESKEAKSFPAQVLDGAAGRWQAELTLFPGQNTIQGVIANPWRGEKAAGWELNLRYLRPPRITKFPEKVIVSARNKVALTLTVEGPRDRAPTEIKVNRQAVDFKADQPVIKADRSTWQVRLEELFVHDGERDLDQLSIQAITDEGESPEVDIPVVRPVVPKRPPPRPPSARFLRPTKSDTTSRPEYAVAFEVRSKTKLERVEIRRGGEVLFRANLEKVPQENQEYVLREDSIPLKLRDGPNTLELVAVNADGPAPPEAVVVSYTVPPVLISIDRIALGDQEGAAAKGQKELRPTYLPDGTVTFPKAPTSLVWLHGQVRWSGPQAQALNATKIKVMVKVQDCRQFPEELKPRQPKDPANVRRFVVPLVLIDKSNKIKIEVAAASQQDLSRHEFELGCLEPERRQRLHLLIIGVDVKDQDADQLKKRVLTALGAQDAPPERRGKFKKLPFATCFLYHVHTGEVDRSHVEAKLEEINAEIKRFHQDSRFLNDVVLIYYQGQDVEVDGGKERWLKTSLNRLYPAVPLKNYAIPCHQLPRVAGAQLLILNVAGATDADVAAGNWGGDPDAGLMRYANRDAAATANPDTPLLSLLQRAIREKDKLGEVAQFVDDLLGKQALKAQWKPALDAAQQERPISVKLNR